MGFQTSFVCRQCPSDLQTPSSLWGLQRGFHTTVMDPITAMWIAHAMGHIWKVPNAVMYDYVLCFFLLNLSLPIIQKYCIIWVPLCMRKHKIWRLGFQNPNLVRLPSAVCAKFYLLQKTAAYYRSQNLKQFFLPSILPKNEFEKLSNSAIRV